jgi:glycogen operon protein
VTAHDGFTVNDLVSYNDKHNDANGEDNRDGADDNNSWNCGTEGPTDDEGIVELRERQKRNLIATLFFSEGVPMILGGDELSHSQGGNNNTYCHDNDLTWLDWDLDERRQKFLDFVRYCADIYKEQPVLQRRKFFLGRALRGANIKDITFFDNAGNEMSDDAWNTGWIRSLGVRLAGDVINEVDERGEPIVGDTLLLLINAHWEQLPFVLPKTKAIHVWEMLVDTAERGGVPVVWTGGQEYPLYGRSLALLRTNTPERAGTRVSPAQVEALRREARRAHTPSPSDTGVG